MEHLGPHRTFVDPHDTRGIVKVVKSTPIPLRMEPLEGTKKMLCPKDKVFVEKITRVPHDEAPPQVATSFGLVALVCMVLVLLSNWTGWMLKGVQFEFWNRWSKAFPSTADQVGAILNQTMLTLLIVCFLGAHIFGLLSHILSKGKVGMGKWAVGGLYLGLYFNLILRSLFI